MRLSLPSHPAHGVAVAHAPIPAGGRELLREYMAQDELFPERG